MTREEYLTVLQKLGLGRTSKRTARLLGMSIDGIAHISAGRRKVSGPIAMLLAMYQKHGLPDRRAPSRPPPAQRKPAMRLNRLGPQLPLNPLSTITSA